MSSVNYLSNVEADHLGRVAWNISRNCFLYYQQGSKSLRINSAKFVQI